MSEQFCACLDALRSGDNETRRVAEQQWGLFKSDALAVVTNMMQVLESSDDVGHRSLVAILLRGVVLRESSIIEGLEDNTFDHFRQSILHVMIHEAVPFVRRQIAYAVAPLAKLRPWPDLLESLPQLASSQESEHHVLCFFLLDKLAEYIGPILVEESNLAIVCAMLEPVIAPNEDSSSVLDTKATHSAAACASLSLLHELPIFSTNIPSGSDEYLHQQQQLIASTIPFTLQFLRHCMSADDMTNMSTVCESLGHLVKARPTLFRDSWIPFLEIIRDACTGISAADNGVSDDSVKCLLLEMMVDLLTGRESAAFCCNQQSRESCLELCIFLINHVEISESPHEVDESYLCEWLRDTEDVFGDEDGEEMNSTTMAGTILSTFLRKWPIEETSNHCRSYVESTLNSQSKINALRTSLYITSMLFDLLGAEMQDMLPTVVSTLLVLVDHPHPRVRLCSLLCFKSLILSEHDEDEGGANFRIMFHEIFFHMIIKSIHDNILYPRLVAQGLNVLRAFCDPLSCPQDFILPFTENILEIAWDFISKSESYPTFILEECVPLIGNLSVIDRESFAPHYSGFMGILSTILVPSTPATSTNYMQELRGKCLECCALMGTSVGFEVFLPDATKLLEFMISLQAEAVSHEEELDFSDPIMTYVVQAFARIAGVLGNVFEPYLKQVIPTLLQHISLDVEHIVQTEEQFSGENSNDEDFVTVYQRGTGKVRFFNNSHAMREKEMSLRTLYQYILDVPHLIIPYVSDILHSISFIKPASCCWEGNAESLTIIGAIISDSCKVWFHNLNSVEAQTGATERVVEISSCYVLTTLQEANKLSLDIIEDLDFSAAAVDNVRLVVQICAENCERGLPSYITYDKGCDFFSALKFQIHLWITRKYDNSSEGVDLPTDEQVDDDMWLGLTDTLGYLFKAMRLDDASRMFEEEVLPFFVPLFPAAEGSVPLLSMIISMLSDAVEAFAMNPILCNSIIELLSPYLFQYSNQDDLAILCMYGIGACALHGDCGSAWESYSDVASSTLQESLGCVSVHDEENCDEELKGTIVSSLFKLGISHVKFKVVLVEVLEKLLPLGCFPYEARECHTLLIDQMSATNSALLGGDCGDNLPLLFTIVAQLAALYSQALMVLGHSSQISDGSPPIHRDDSDFWDQQLVPENFGEKIKTIFIPSDQDGLICGQSIETVMAIIKSLPDEYQQYLDPFTCP